MTAKIKVKLRRMSNFGVNCGASRDVATLSNLEYKQQICKANLKDIKKKKTLESQKIS